MISRKEKDLSKVTGFPPGTSLEKDRVQFVLGGLFCKWLLRPAARNLKTWISISPEVAYNSRGRVFEAWDQRGGGGESSKESVLLQGGRHLVLPLHLTHTPHMVPGRVFTSVP